MTIPLRIQRQRKAGWRMPDNTIYVGRPSIWGNPFVHSDRAKAVAAYRLLIAGGTQSFEMGPGKLQFAKDMHPMTTHWAYGDYVRQHINDLRGKNLACWCALGEPCHADVLLEMANRPT